MTYQTAKSLLYDSKQWPPRCYPCIKLICEKINPSTTALFKAPAGTTDQLNKLLPPWQNGSPCGSVTENPTVTSCAFFIPAPDTSGSWRLTPGSSIFSAELHGIKQALSTIYNYDHPPPGVHIFSDSSQIPKNKCIGEIRNLLGCLKSSGSNVTLYWIPNHTGITGNEKADRLASDEASSPSGNYITNELSPREHQSILKKEWETYVLLNLKKCNKPSVQMKNKLVSSRGIIPKTEPLQLASIA
jgi:ribonuclease HI